LATHFVFLENAYAEIKVRREKREENKEKKNDSSKPNKCS